LTCCGTWAPAAAAGGNEGAAATGLCRAIRSSSVHSSSLAFFYTARPLPHAKLLTIVNGRYLRDSAASLLCLFFWNKTTFRVGFSAGWAFFRFSPFMTVTFRDDV